MAKQYSISTLPNSAYQLPHQSFLRKPTSKNTRTHQNVLWIRIQKPSERGRLVWLEKEKRLERGVHCGSGRIGSCGGMLSSKAFAKGNRYIANINPSTSADEYAVFRKKVIPLEPSKETIIDSISHTRTGENIQVDTLTILKIKLENEGIHFDSFILPEYLMPEGGLLFLLKCGGSQQKYRSFSLFIHEDLKLAMWLCFRDQCGWRDHVRASSMDNRSSASATENVRFKSNKESTKKAIKFESFTEEVSGEVGAHGATVNKIVNAKGYRVLTEESLRLEPLCEKLIVYFSERMISLKTLQRNGVMQRKNKDQIFIAFPYRQNSTLISCKYRSLDKQFWQERGTKSILYGVDDIRQASDIIIVEGEMDKLSMEEAGYHNCVSVPNGAPQKVSRKKPPNEEEDTKHRYLYSCKEYLDKASRIILASDADPPGQALAEELVQHVGAERCSCVWDQIH